MLKKLFLVGIIFLVSKNMHSQFLMDMVDTTKETGKGLLAIYKKYDHIKIGGYIQPQFQIGQIKGVKNFEGGDFGPLVSNRFMLRRSRVRIDYVHNDANSTKPGVQIVFQFDANERSFTVRDVWGRVFDNKWKVLSFTTGMFARPFGYEINLSSSDRESPERGRMSQTLMKSERDLGAMVSFDVRKKHHKLKNIKIDLGMFNGQGINATGDFDNYKDFIGRVALKPIHLNKNVVLSASTSALIGGLENNTRNVFSTQDVAGIKKMVVDTAITNIGSKATRNYFGVDAQLKIKNKVGATEIRAELITGKQTGTSISSETPSAILTNPLDGFHIRNFNGAYFYVVQNVFSTNHQVLLKLDWYDPNTKVKGNEVGAVGSNFGSANIKYTTLGLGYINHINSNTKLTLYYAKVWNEKTALVGFTEDVKDDVFTCRIQFRF